MEGVEVAEEEMLLSESEKMSKFSHEECFYFSNGQLNCVNLVAPI